MKKLETRKRECPSCRVISVDGGPPDPEWRCRCFMWNGAQTFSFTGPGFNGLWVEGGEGVPVSGGNEFLVTRPTDGMQFKVVASCS